MMYEFQLFDDRDSCIDTMTIESSVEYDLDTLHEFLKIHFDQIGFVVGAVNSFKISIKDSIDSL